LTHLSIANLALLSDVELELGPGFNVLTGETGAGKSLIVDALLLLRGGRASPDLIRTGASEARIEAVFALPVAADGSEATARRRLGELLGRAGLEGDEPMADTSSSATLVVQRVVARSGRNRVFINGSLATVGLLEEVMASLVEICGQHENQRLANGGHVLELVDQAAGTTELRAEVDAELRELRRVAAELVAVEEAARARAEREDFLAYQLREIDELSPTLGEDEALKLERERLRSVGKLQAAAVGSEQLLYGGEPSVVDLLSRADRLLGECSSIDPQLAGLQEELASARLTCEEAARSLARYAERLSAEPERLGEIEERQHALGRLLRKHGASVADVLHRRTELVAELATLEASGERRGELGKELEQRRGAIALKAERLSRLRAATAAELSAAIAVRLRELDMAGAALQVMIVPKGAAAVVSRGASGERPATAPSREEPPAGGAHLLFDEPSGGGTRRLGEGGWDRAELRLAANPGEEPRPLARVASGGELSRITLALKQVLAERDPVATYVFDEIDAGIGGPTGDAVGVSLARVARHRQVLCVTHLAQIAARADRHFVVRKAVEAGRTRTAVVAVRGASRRDEIARMLSGSEVGAPARNLAEAMLAGGSATSAPLGVEKEGPVAPGS
jgi:DNA repair protein RecN (Recombination protein N)